MSTDYNYDEQGQFFPYFVTTISALITVPLTYSLLKPSKEIENTAPRIHSDFQPKHADLVETNKRKQKRRERKTKRMITVVLGWAVISWMIYLMIVTTRTSPKLWDPYEVLGVSMSATEKQITSHFRKLSRTMHPDKRQPDPENGLTIQIINDEWVDITKAHKALTDEEIRNNYLQYGHPDGKQSFSIGIALPQFIVTEGNGKYVLLVYAALLGVLLPYFVGKWWYGTQRVTREKVLVSTAGNLFREYTEGLDENGVIAALSTGDEFREILAGNRAEEGLSKLEQAIFSSDSSPATSQEIPEKHRTALQETEDPVRRKTLALLWAYVRRVELDDKNLNLEKYDVGPTAVQLIESFMVIANAFSNVQPVLAAFRAQQHLIQAIPPGGSPLLQLPHFNDKIVRAIEGNARTHLTIQDLMELTNASRKKLVVGRDLLTENQYKQAMQVARQIPYVDIERAWFKVTGEKVVLPSSLVSLVIKARVIPPGSQNVPDVKEEDLEDIDPPEGDLDALNGRKKGKLGAANPDEDRAQPPLVHAPYYARDYSPRWHLFLADSKQGKIAVPSSSYQTFEKPLFDSEGKPTYNVQTIKLQFGAPPQPGQYTFAMNLICDGYVGFDSKIEITLEVEDPSNAAEADSEDDISEPDEDTIAGQMSALKGGPVKKRPEDAESSDDESDTEGEEESESETDTETESDEE